MIICDHPSLFTQCCQRTSHVISLAKSSIKSGQRRSGPGNLSRKACQIFFFPYQTRDKPHTASQRGERLPTPISTKLYIASVHNGHLRWSRKRDRESLGVADISLKAQQFPSFVPAQTLLSASQKAPEVYDFWNKKLLGGTTPLAKNI